MRSLLHGWSLDAKSGMMDEEFNKVIDIVEKYELLNKAEDCGETSEEGVFTLEHKPEKCHYFKRVREDKEVYDFFVDNLHIHVSLSEKEGKIYSIRLKRAADEWQFNEKDEAVCFSHPLNDTYEVYVKYNIPVLDVTRANGYLYKHGSWDKYVYKTLMNFFKASKDFTITSKFNENYRSVKAKKKLIF